MKTKKIRVTSRDIKRGEPGNDQFCPVALAIGRAFKTKNVSVCWGVVVKNKDYTYPKSVNKFIGRFDGGLKVEPFSFELKEVIFDDSY